MSDTLGRYVPVWAIGANGTSSPAVTPVSVALSISLCPLHVAPDFPHYIPGDPLVDGLMRQERVPCIMFSSKVKRLTAKSDVAVNFSTRSPLP